MIDQLAALLTESRQRGFLGPGPVEDHLDHARAFAVVVGSAPAMAVDLGAGGGLPGLVLAAITWPETSWVFLDAQQKRSAFLLEAVDVLGLDGRVRVATSRAEEFGRDPVERARYDLVVARSFGPPAVTAECGAPLLRAGGRMVVSEPPTAGSDRWPVAGLSLLGCGPAQQSVVDEAAPVHLVSITQIEACPDRYPRRVGIPAKRPLF